MSKLTVIAEILDPDRVSLTNSDFNKLIHRLDELEAKTMGWSEQDEEEYQAIQRAIRAAVEAEREACAQIVENADVPDCGGWSAIGIAEAIRKRSNPEN